MNARRLFLLSALVLLAACSAKYEVAATPNVRYEEWVQGPFAPQIHVQPTTPAPGPMTAVFLPLRMQQSIEHASHYGREIGRFFWQTWNQERVFKIFEYAEETPFTNVTAALTVARAKGADLAVVGYITYLLAGGTTGESKMSLRVEIYDARSGALVWSMANTGHMESELTRDYIVFTTDSRLPHDPIYALTLSLARGMADPVKEWINYEKNHQKKNKTKEAPLPGSKQTF